MQKAKQNIYTEEKSKFLTVFHLFLLLCLTVNNPANTTQWHASVHFLEPHQIKFSNRTLNDAFSLCCKNTNQLPIEKAELQMDLYSFLQAHCQNKVFTSSSDLAEKAVCEMVFPSFENHISCWGKCVKKSHGKALTEFKFFEIPNSENELNAMDKWLWWEFSGPDNKKDQALFGIKCLRSEATIKIFMVCLNGWLRGNEFIIYRNRASYACLTRSELEVANTEDYLVNFLVWAMICKQPYTTCFKHNIEKSLPEFLQDLLRKHTLSDFALCDSNENAWVHCTVCLRFNAQFPGNYKICKDCLSKQCNTLGQSILYQSVLTPIDNTRLNEL